MTYCSHIFTEESLHITLVGVVVTVDFLAQLFQSGLSKFACFMASQEQFLSHDFDALRETHVSNWCHSNKWWIMQCMNLQLPSDDYSSHHKSWESGSKTIRSSELSTRFNGHFCGFRN